MIYSEKVLSTLWRGQPVDNDLVVLYVPREGFFPTSYTVMIDGKRCRRSTKLYNCWTNMSQRCLDGSQQQQKIKSYVGCTSNFKSYQEFAEFCYNLHNFTCLDGKGNPYEIDKDVKGFLTKQPSLYSKETLCMLPKDINCFLTCVQKHNEKLTRSTKGVIQEYGGKYNVRTQDVCGDGERKIMQYCSSYQESYDYLRNLKKKQASFLAEKYKSSIEQCVIDFLNNFDLDVWEKWTYEKWENKEVKK